MMMILGDDFPILDNVIQQTSKDCTCMVVTRSITKGLEPLPNLDDELIHTGTKVRKSRRQRRQEKNRGFVRGQTPTVTNLESSVIDPQWQMPDNFRECQKNDSTLKSLFDKVFEVDGVPVEGFHGLPGVTADPFVLKDNLLYLADTETPRLVIPTEYSQVILHLGYSVPWTGHLGQAKTYDRVSQRFYWPGLYKDVQAYCKTCHACQVVAPARKSDRGYLQPLTIMSVPYERIAMDIIGPLPKSSSGCKYALVVCDYATRYPDVYPLRSIQVKHVVRCLVELFSRVGIPKEILTDQGTNFMSHLMKAMYAQLGVKGIRTTHSVSS